MGSCFDKKGREDGNSSSLQTSDKATLLYKYMGREVIQEEDSQLRISCQSAFENLSHESSAIIATKQRFKDMLTRARQLGDEITPKMQVTIRNLVTGRYLHSHALKSQGTRWYDVCSCPQGGHEHDWWILKCEEEEPLKDGRIIRIQHKLTNALLRSSGLVRTPRTKLQAVGGALQWEQHEEEWRLEFVGGKVGGELHLNQLFRLRHVVSEGCLHTGKNHGQVHDYFEVSVCFRNDAKDVWYVEQME